jgi:xylulokinase
VDYLLGLDVGTTATKALLFDLSGKAVATASYGYGLITPREGWVEQDPEELWRGVTETCRSLASRLDPGDRVLALSQASQGATTIPADAAGHPIGNAISWMDQRAHEQADGARATWGEAFLHTTTGWPVFDGLPLQHIAWLRECRPAEYAAARFFLFVNDFIGLRLTAQRCMNPSDASITQLFNIAEGDWDRRLLESVGIARDQLSPLHPSGHVIGRLTAAASDATGLPADVLVVNGAHDQYCAAVGTGVTRPGLVLLSCGTAWVILAVPESREAGLRSGMAISRHAIDGRWGAVRSLGGVGTSLEWFLDNVWRGDSSGAAREGLYDAVNAGAGRSPAGAKGLLFYPLAGGHGVGIGASRGGFAGLTLAHGRDDMARAVMEGIACELRWALEEICDAGIEVDELKMVGGASRSAVWPRIVADITGIPVAMPAVSQAAGFGAAILAGVGAGLFPDAEAGRFGSQGAETRLEPEPDACCCYDDLFARYRSAWPVMTSSS